MINQCGYLELRIGPMKSGKSSYIGLKIAKLSDEGYKCLFVTHSIDERDESMNIKSDGTFSRHGTSSLILSKDIDRKKIEKLSDLNVDDYHAIAVDECQFFGEEMVDTIKGWVNKKHKIVLCAGLDGDIYRKPFGHLLKLIPEADDVTKQNADCLECQRELRENGFTHFNLLNFRAPFSALLNQKSTGDLGEDQIHIGGSDIYTSVCRYHHQKLHPL